MIFERKRKRIDVVLTPSDTHTPSDKSVFLIFHQFPCLKKIHVHGIATILCDGQFFECQASCSMIYDMIFANFITILSNPYGSSSLVCHLSKILT